MREIRSTTRKRARVDESEDEDYNTRYRPPPFCPDCGVRSHPGNCRPRCHCCDKRHFGVCTAFCRKCTDIGHSWRHCRLFIPNHIWRKEHCGLHTAIQNMNITVPVIDPAPTYTPTSLNAAILSQLDIALHGLHRKAGIPNHSRVMLNNVNITTNILASERKGPLAPDTSLLDRVQRIPTGPRSNVHNTRPAATKPTFAQSAFARSAFSQPVFGQTAFSQPTFIHNNSIGMTPTWPRHIQLSVDSKC